MADVSFLVTPFVAMAIEKVTSLISREFPATFGVKEDVKNLSNKLAAIQAVLKDAEDSQVKDGSLKDWVEKLQDAAYDAEDILDAFSTQVQLWNRKQLVRCRPPFSVSKVSFQYDIALKMKKLLTRLEVIHQEKEQFQLVRKDSVPGTGTVYPQLLFRCMVHMFLVEKNDKTSIVELLKSDEFDKEGEVSVIPITGMGGLGKSTLAQLVYNDETVKNCFEFRMWVCVTVNFDLSRILKDITNQLLDLKSGTNFPISPQGSHIQEFLAGKKFLLVLDDVWTENYLEWESLKKILERGKKGSKVLVTSRNTQVSRIMGARDTYKLGHLPEDECWSLFKRIAFINYNWSCGELEKMGRDIVCKCQGLPLAVKAMAGVLRGNVDVNKWQRILRNDVWDAEKNTPSILPALQLSYHNLPSHLRQCYAFCSLFPKAHIFNKKELVKLWAAEGFIQSSLQERAEGTGNEYFDELSMRSFFQPLDGEEKENYRMHDLIHDLATLVSSPYCCQAKDTNISDRLRHASLLCEDVEQPVVKIIDTSKSLRTLLFPNHHLKDFKQQTLNKIFHTMTYIRVLDLSSSTILELPQSIGKLKLLRYLDLSTTEIPRLPDSLCNLYNLQMLKLLRCPWLFELPMDLGKLINLQHLELDDMFWHKVTMLPPSIGRLTNLQNCHAFRVGSEKGYGIEELKDMAYLTGTLHISKLERTANAREAKLDHKKGLDKLVLEWSDRDAAPQDQAAEEAVLEELKPHSNLKELQICHYRGTSLPVWMRDGLLQNLVAVSLKHCTNCGVLLLGQLPHLEQLCIKGMQELEDWPEGEFRSLDTLKISNCPKLRKLPSFFPNLRVLKIKNCDSLKALAVTRSMKFLTLVNNPVLEDWQQTFHPNFSYNKLLELKIICCPKLPTLPQGFAPQKLEISGCELLTALPVPEFSRRLHHLALDACQDGTVVEAIPETSSLDSLVISNISNITSLPSLPHLPGLKSYIHNCKDLVSLSAEAAPLQHLTSLNTYPSTAAPSL